MPTIDGANPAQGSRSSRAFSLPSIANGTELCMWVIRQPSAARDDQDAGFLPRVAVVDLLFLRGIVGAGRDGSAAGAFAPAASSHAAMSSGWKHRVFQITRLRDPPGLHDWVGQTMRT